MEVQSSKNVGARDGGGPMLPAQITTASRRSPSRPGASTLLCAISQGVYVHEERPRHLKTGAGL